MAESDLLMQCDEDDLAPWQRSTAPSYGSPVAQVIGPSDQGSPKSVAMSDVSVTTVPVASMLKPQVLPMQIAISAGSGSTSAQPPYITSETVAVQKGPRNACLATCPVQLILNGQAVTVLPAIPGHQVIAPKILSVPQASETVNRGILTAVQIPMNLTLANSSVTAVPSDVAVQVGTASSDNNSIPSPALAPAANVPAVLPTTPTVDVGGQQQAVTPVLQPDSTCIAIMKSVGSPVPSPPALPSTLVPPSTSSQSLDPESPVDMPVLRSSGPTHCPRCLATYKTVSSLRGYICMCNTKLVRSLDALGGSMRHKWTSDVAGFSRGGHRTAGVFTPPKVTQTVVQGEGPIHGHLQAGPDGKLIMLLDDFYYGLDPGSGVLKTPVDKAVPFRCNLCDRKMKNNLRMMAHMKQHVESEEQSRETDAHNNCQHCFRVFSSPFTLQCHVEGVHSQIESSRKCKICEWEYESEPVLLQHMKNSHKPGEMPYICQVCDFRSSFYQHIICHFNEVHSNTTYLLCPYCLKVFKTSSKYQLHYIRHQKKSVLHCDKCRLQFLFVKDRIDHRMHHNTHQKPQQLEGLKPGTKLTIRTYKTLQPQMMTPDFDAHISTSGQTTAEQKLLPPPPPAAQNLPKQTTPTKKRPVENMHDFLAKFEKQRLSRPGDNDRCLECSLSIPDYSTHFPTYVHCSLCHFGTCCSMAYANHMINNHIPRKVASSTTYHAIFSSCTRGDDLWCMLCNFTTKVGDVMAKHLLEKPEHYASVKRPQEGFSRGYTRFLFIPFDRLQEEHKFTFRNQVALQGYRHNSQENQDKPVPILPKEASVTEPRPTGNLTSGSSERVEQLKMILLALCSGVPLAASCFHTKPEQIQGWLSEWKQQKPRWDQEWVSPWMADLLVEWVLAQHEQQLPVNEENFFQKVQDYAQTGGTVAEISYEWAVDFLVHHDLSMQTLGIRECVLPQNAKLNVYSFINFVKKQKTMQMFRLSDIGLVDEMPVFVDFDQLLQPQSSSPTSSSLVSAFQLTGSGHPLMDIMLAALADGTLLPPVAFLKCAPLDPEAIVPSTIIVEVKGEGFSDGERLQLWMEKVWHWHVNASAGGKGLLLMDSYRGHLDDDFLAALNSSNTLPAVVPVCCSARLLPLEACAGPVLREHLQARWVQRVTSSPQDLLMAPPNLALLLLGWLAEFLEALSSQPELLQRSFQVASSERAQGEAVAEMRHALTWALVTTDVQEVEPGNLATTQSRALKNLQPELVNSAGCS
ncbi:uncharacterized protein pogza isoform X2 [Denticeps clupeoides]|uniref:uncharacterized protein pogza isoform X2 n=1 Tax=Denticeps clupeoides TaxID=299321 RepID=UPI0010A33E3B|nr:pogo transposable element with ZNF domain isoform X2 [Denticeps clupeoides]